MKYLELTPKQTHWLVGATIFFFCFFCAVFYYVLFSQVATQPIKPIFPIPVSNIAGQSGRVK